ncbi:DUF6053 domain-containing protein [Lysobacter enzymogenes]
MGGLSGPMLSAQIAAIGNESIGPEGPPTKAAHPACFLTASQRLRMKT